MKHSNQGITDGPIQQNAVSLITAQDKISDWHIRMKDLFNLPDEEIPKGIFINLEDLQQVVNGIGQFAPGYIVRGARLYFCFDSEDTYHIKGLLVPTGYKAGTPDVIVDNDIVLDLTTGLEDNIDPNALVSVFDFTLPCPPLGNCNGASGVLNNSTDRKL